jgi:hypothetical protein
MSMQEQKDITQTEKNKPQTPDGFTENQSSIVESHIVIKDPETNEILINRRD